MDVDGEIRFLANARGEPHDLNAPAGKTAEFGMGFNPLDEVGIFPGGAHGCLDIHAIGPVERRIGMAFQPTHEVGLQKGIHTTLVWLHNELAETRQRHAARTTLIDQGGNPRVYPDYIGVKAKPAGYVLIHVRMGVDQTRQHQLARHIEHCLGVTPRNVRTHRGDAAILYRYIVGAVDTLGRINHPATA